MDAKLKEYWVSFKTHFSAYARAVLDFLSKNKTIFLVVIPLIIWAKFRDLITQWLIFKTKNEVDADKKKNDILNADVEKDNLQANTLISQAETLANTKPVIDSNWDKK